VKRNSFVRQTINEGINVYSLAFWRRDRRKNGTQHDDTQPTEAQQNETEHNAD
jgi:hypothetical protein